MENGNGHAAEGPSGRVVHLEVENFKSYRGHQLIGPFRDFTAIVGPNVRRAPAWRCLPDFYRAERLLDRNI